MLSDLDNKRPEIAFGRRVLCAFFAMCFVAVSWNRVEACRVCFLLPKKTAADFLIESELVVLARENLDQPFCYSAVENLKGHSTIAKFGLFVDSTTRRLLKANPKYAVVLVRKNEDDPWQSLGIADSQYQEVIKRILAFSEQWTSEGGSKDRYKFFLSLLGSKNRTIFELAYLELGRAPYSTIKKMAKLVSPARSSSNPCTVVSILNGAPWPFCCWLKIPASKIRNSSKALLKAVTSFP